MNIVLAIYKAIDRKNYKKVTDVEGKLAGLKSDEIVIQTSFCAVTSAGKQLQDDGYAEDESIGTQKATIEILTSDVPHDKKKIVIIPFKNKKFDKYNDSEITHPSFQAHREFFVQIVKGGIHHISAPLLAKIEGIEKIYARMAIDELEKAKILYKRNSFWMITPKVRDNIKHFLITSEESVIKMKKMKVSGAEEMKENEDTETRERTRKFRKYGKLEEGALQNIVKEYDEQYEESTDDRRNQLIKEMEKISNTNVGFKKKNSLVEKIRTRYKIGKKYKNDEE